MNPTERLPDGHLFGRHRIVRLIAEGGMGVVYEAVHSDLKKRVALKTLLPIYCRNEEARTRFLREAEAVARIDHPNVVTVSDVGVQEGMPYMVMELLEGQTLGALLAERGALEVATALALLLPAMAAVAAGHGRGVIHRDLTPHNIFLATGRRRGVVPKILDFGVSKLMADDSPILTKTFTVLGTAAYMSPEQARGARHVDFRSDQYSLGVIFYEMLAGQRARPGDSALEVLHLAASGFVPALGDVKPEHRSSGIEAVLTRMLAPSPPDRYPSLGHAARALLPFADEETRLAMGSEFPAAEAPAGAAESAAGGGLSGSRERSEVPSGRMGGTLLMPKTSDAPSPATIEIAAAGPSTNVQTARVRRLSTRTALVAFGTASTVVTCGVLLGMLGRPEPSAAARDAAPDLWRASASAPLPAVRAAPAGARSAAPDHPFAAAPRPASELRVEHPRGDAGPSPADELAGPARGRAVGAAAKPPGAVKAVPHRASKRAVLSRTPGRGTTGAVRSEGRAPVQRGTNNALIITN